MRIRLLGGLEVTSREHRQVRFTTRKTSLLFAALVLAGHRGHRREPLSEAFWPGRGSDQARNSLRQALVDIRRSFPAGGDATIYIDGDQETIALITGPEETDISIFDRKLEAGRTADLAFAADLYRGEVLAGEAIPDGLDEWFRPYRSTYQRKALQLVERLSLAFSEPGSGEESACERLAERLLAADPTIEGAHRALIRIHTLRGHENAALRQFEACRALLRKHLQAEPEAETSSLAASLQSRQGSEYQRSAPGPDLVPQPQAISAPAKHHDRPSVAVLPFQNLSGDAEQEYFADGIVEDITIALAQFRHLYVIARNSSFTYKGQAVDIKQVGRELDVRYVVEGSVRRTGDRLRIAGQLIDTSTGAHLWADRFDGTLANVFDLQDQVASSIVGAITPKVEEAEIERAKRKPTESLDAYDYYLRGLAAFDRTITSRSVVDEALRLFMKAIERDPEFAIAHARAARCYATRKSNGWMVNPAEETAEATRLARRAVELGWDDAVTLSYGGYVIGYVGGDLDGSAACIDRAVFLNPNLAAALGVSSWVKACLGEPDMAVEHAALAMRLSPLDPRLFAWQFNTGLAHFCAGRYDDATAWAGKSLRHQPNYPSAMRVMAAGQAMAGRIGQAQETVARLCLMDPALRLSNLADVLPPFRRPDDRARYIEALRMAGLPA
ncbi:TolB-like protein/DNA-binding SARP family transcriptional activator [Rhizobium sp. BK226]|uniref:BTAD domain-containing putative transcriptional regulator n=1 Tax=Rhizobium TaxID=379 RepID=UPI0007B500E8|nr:MULTISPECIES: BTAD domain-containing putative transcriptional regulator [Rhizobium]KZS52593.1 adenylate cyclase [Rhizobium anhuiense bv. trifolii]MBB3297112.1 TolB-like protein/DNA-binding SARP family transcriptional activator [Rhizobium sp. BK112]MBB3366327.1 TolB-like protein/DNA-binding SARP family transcriptional activator [Rhizobium sp. BK077]MBB3741304.1 TolB-like protein/DNA-binding SARP family transcriptional activator [Rhizobium sp. BK591]MBB4110988.1 TolB-like protein/DNA-binding 